MSGEVLPTVLALMGPTASGKTRLGIELALALKGEVISVDSGLVYRGMDIGTAKPDLEERQGVPHHLIDILDPNEAFSTGSFRSQALERINDIIARGKLPILVGGTMLYFRALFQGLAELPPADRVVRAQIDAEAVSRGWCSLHDDLKAVDPGSAARIHPNDPQRIQRALEVYRITGQTLTELWQRAGTKALPFRFIRMILAPLDRESLSRRIAERFARMLEEGLVAEVEQLYQRGDLDPSMPSIRAVGYRQVWQYLEGELDYAVMLERGIIATRQFAKRQFTWLRRENADFGYQSEDPNLVARAISDLARSL